MIKYHPEHRLVEPISVGPSPLYLPCNCWYSVHTGFIALKIVSSSCSLDKSVIPHPHFLPQTYLSAPLGLQTPFILASYIQGICHLPEFFLHASRGIPTYLNLLIQCAKASWSQPVWTVNTSLRPTDCINLTGSFNVVYPHLVCMA